MQTFDLYRYQLLPNSQSQYSLFDKKLTADEIRQNKNIFFNDALKNIPQFHTVKSQVKHKSVFHQDNWFVLKIGSHKSINRDTEEFSIEKIETWPNVTVIVNNNSEKQIIAISRNKKAFPKTRSVVNLLGAALNHSLNAQGLSIEISEIFEKNNFWQLIQKYEKRITKIRFEMIAPNMANISKVLTLDLKQLNRDSNCHKANIEIEAPNNASLEVNESNPLINSCVAYAAEGGGEVSLKIIGLKKQIKTSESIRTVEIGEAHMTNPTPNLLKSLLDF